MTEPLQVGQFAIVDHEPVERGPNAGIFTGRGPADDRPELYLLAEGTTPAGEAFAGHVISAAGQRWSSLDMSITGALKRVFDDADASLADWNRKSIAQHRVRIGMSGLARRGEQTVLAQAGPSVVFHATNRGTVAYFTDEEHATPLGAGRPLEPQLRRIDLRPGDRLLMISTSALTEMDDDLIAGILALPAEQVLANLFRRVRGLRDVTALFLAQGVRATATLAPAQSERAAGTGAGDDVAIGEGDDGPRGFQPSLFITERAEDDVEEARRQLVAVSERVRTLAPVMPAVAAPVAAPRPLRRVVGGEEAAFPGRARASLAGGAALPRRLPGGAPQVLEPARRDESFTRKLSSRRPPPPLAPAAAPPVSELADDLRARQKSALPIVDTLPAADGPRLEATPIIQVRNAPGRRFRGGTALLSRNGAGRTGHLSTWLIAGGGILALLIVVGLLAGPQLLNRSGDEKFASLIEGAERNLASARAIQDPAARRKAYTEAHAMLLQARDIAPESTEVSRLLIQVDDGLKVIDAVKLPARVDDLANLEQFGAAPVTADSLIAAGDLVYLLDTAGGQVIAVPLDGTLPSTVYTADASAARARPIAIAYYAATDLGQPTVLIADNERRLWSIEAGAVRPVRFAVPGNVTDIAVWGSALYVLDAPGKAVYRLLPADGGFVNPTLVLKGDQLANAARITVAGDEVYTADRDGTLHRFAGALALTLAASGIDRPLSVARKPWPVGDSGEIAVLDPPNARIVVLAADGAYSHQYRHPDFATSHALAMADGRAYIFSGGHLRLITFGE